MKKAAAILLILLLPTPLFSQFITTSTSQTVPLMVQNVLLSNNGIPSCGGTIFNVTWQAGPSASSTNGIGTFTNTNPNFPMTSGMILSTGNVSDAPGPNTTTQGFGSNAWAGDGQLLTYMQSLGFNVTTYRNAAILEFDFVPLTNIMNFDFVFASEEYGVFQCTYSDAFAFFLNNVTTGTPVENLALIPATTIPISVTSIRDAQFNLGTTTCTSENVSYFGAFYGAGNGASAPINFNGRTVKMQANKVVVAGQRYHIKFVIADRNDNDYDSAVFLGNFTTGEFVSGTGQYAGLGDLSAAANQAVCNAPTTIQAGPTAITNATYTWTLNSSATPITGANLHTYTATQPGTYSVLMTLPNGCQLTDSIVIDFLPAITANPAGNLTACTGNTFNLNSKKPAILGTLAASSHPIKFFTSLPNAEASSGALTNLQASSFPGTEGQQIWARLDDESNGNGCFVIQSFFLNFTTAITPLFTQLGPFCVGENFTLPITSTNSPAISGTWSPAINNTATTTYTFTPNLALFPCAVNTQMTVAINSTPTTPTFDAIAPVCSGSVIAPLPTSSTNTPPIAGSWTPALNNTTTTTYTFNPNVGSCATSTTLQIVVNTAPTVTVNSPNVCAGLSTAVTATAGAAGSYSYAWTVPSGAPAVGNVASFSTSVAGIYSVIITNTVTNCPSASASGTVSQIALPTVNVTAPAACAGSSATVTAVPGAAASYTYAWTVPAGAPAVGSVPSFTTSVAGTYSVVITNTTTGCISASANATVVINPNPTATVNNATVCSGSPALITASPTTGVATDYSYAWTVPAAATNPGNVNSFSTSIAGNYSVIITRISTNCSSVSASGTVTVNTTPIATVTNASICNGLAAAVSVSTTTAGPFSYVWSVPTGAAAVGDVASFSTTVAGTYSVVVTNTATNCPSASASGIVTVNPLPTVLLNSPSACSGNSANLIAIPGNAGSYTYTWTVPAGASNPGSVANFQTTTAGNYSVTITNTVTGCISASSSGVVTIAPIATVLVSSPAVCEGSSASVLATPSSGVAADYRFVWTVPAGVTNPGNTNTFSTNVVGNYSVIATSIATNCPSAAVSVVVKINPKPVVTLPQNGYICVDASGATIAGSGSSFVLNTNLSAAVYSFEWFTNNTSNGITTPSFTAVTPGTYKVIVTNLATLCSATASATIVPSLPPTAITLTASNYFENNQTISVAVLPAGVYEYQLDGGFYQDSSEFVNVDSGIHEVRVRDKKACGSVGDSILTVDYPHFFTPNGDGFNDKWNVNELKNPSVATIVYVYDRYGKLLKQLAVNGEGWDGTYNGSPMLSDDYWFKILYTEKGIAKEFKAHFSLKR